MGLCFMEFKKLKLISSISIALVSCFNLCVANSSINEGISYLIGEGVNKNKDVACNMALLDVKRQWSGFGLGKIISDVRNSNNKNGDVWVENSSEYVTFEYMAVARLLSYEVFDVRVLDNGMYTCIREGVIKEKLNNEFKYSAKNDNQSIAKDSKEGSEDALKASEIGGVTENTLSNKIIAKDNKGVLRSRRDIYKARTKYTFDKAESFIFQAKDLTELLRSVFKKLYIQTLLLFSKR